MLAGDVSKNGRRLAKLSAITDAKKPDIQAVVARTTSSRPPDSRGSHSGLASEISQCTRMLVCESN